MVQKISFKWCKFAYLMNKKYIITRVWLFSMRRNYTEHKGWDKKKYFPIIDWKKNVNSVHLSID